MKTPDEVISTMEKFWICPSSDEADEYCELLSIQGDALQYLKWYKDLADDSEAFAAWKENPPLTWEELKGMEGKPVWVEWVSGTWKGLHKWVISHGCNDLMMVFTALDVAGVSYDGHLPQMNLGKTWQAYRKERQ